MHKTLLTVAIMGLCWLMNVLPGHGESIVLNGSFGDWVNKPSLSDGIGDELPYNDISEVRWFPDNSEEILYFYVENNGAAATGTLPSSWIVEFRILVEGKWFTANVSVNRIKRMVNVKLYNSTGGQIWSGKGKWADQKGHRLECGLPLNRLLKTIAGGYELKVNVISDSDVAPDNGSIAISSINTFSKLNLLIIGLLTLAGWNRYGRRPCCS